MWATSASTEGDDRPSRFFSACRYALRLGASLISPYAPVRAGMLKLLEPEVTSAQLPRATALHGICWCSPHTISI
ncbi:hypothetical protein D3C75_1177680 [compost metagenome]